MLLRQCDEKEIKAELLLRCVLECVDEKIKHSNKSGKRGIQRFSEFMMTLVVDKVLSVQQSTFLQYIPLYVVNRAKLVYDSRSAKPFDKNASCELLFLTCFVSELIQRAFPEEFLTKKTGKQCKYTTLEARMCAWNYLASLLSKQVFDGAILYKSLSLIIHCHEDSNAKFTDKKKQLSSLFTEIGEGKEMTENEMKMHNDSKLFGHCFVQGLLMILTAQHRTIVDQD
jgi:hypothetical protein